MFQSRRNSLEAGAAVFSHALFQQPSSKPLEDVAKGSVVGSIKRLNEVTSTGTRDFGCFKSRVTGTDLLYCFRERYGPQNSAQTSNEKKQPSRRHNDSFQPNHRIDPVLRLQISHSVKRLCGTSPLTVLGESGKKSLLGELNEEYWRHCMDSLESRLAIRANSETLS